MRIVGGRYTLVLDAGTSRARCFLFDSRGRAVSSCAKAWQFVESGEAYALAREWEVQALWRDICDLIGSCIDKGGVSAGDIRSVAITSQRQAVVFLDEEGLELYAGPNLDLRAFFEGSEIDEAHRERVYRTTGHLPSFLFAPAKLKWFERHMPEAYERVTTVLSLGDWIAYRLTGEIVSERSLTAEAGLLDVGRRDRCHSLLAELGVDIDTGRPVDAASVVGSVGGDAAESTMLKEGTEVVIAGADTQCGLLGMGVHREGEVGIVAGWSVPVQMVTGEPKFSDGASTWAGCYLVPDRWVAESSAGDLGNAYSWLVNLLCGGARGGFEALDAAAGSVAAGSEGMQAILGSVRTRFSGPGMRAGGFIFPVPVTLSELGRGHFARAALESAAYGMRANFEALKSVGAKKAVHLAMGGGMTRTRTLAPIVADVLGRDIRMARAPDASALGAWLCAETAAGEYGTLDEAANWAKERTRVIEPNPGRSAEYQHFYRQWLELTERLDGTDL